MTSPATNLKSPNSSISRKTPSNSYPNTAHPTWLPRQRTLRLDNDSKRNSLGNGLKILTRMPCWATALCCALKTTSMTAYPTATMAQPTAVIPELYLPIPQPCPTPPDYLLDENNAGSLDFEQDNQNYVQVSDNRALDFGNNPFTIEAWVKLETMPTGDNAASIIPVVMKKLTNTSDTALDYMFLAAAGTYGTATSYNKLALHLGSSVITSTLAIPDTNWHHISVALDPANNTVRFTLDNQTDTQTTSATGTANNGPLIIGVHFNSSGVIDSAFDGLIDELSITDGFLAPSELQPLAVVTTPTEFEIKQTALSNDGSQLNITFDSTDTRLFAVQRSYTLEPNSWVNVSSFIPGASGSSETTATEIPVDTNQPKAFYRVIME